MTTRQQVEYSSDLRKRLEWVFDAPFLRLLGIEMVDLESGLCESMLKITSAHLQQDGFVHAGVQATLADHTAGAAAITVVPAEQRVLTAEFKINLLRPARGERLSCIARVLKRGRRLIVVEADVFAYRNENRFLTAKAIVTITPIAT